MSVNQPAYKILTWGCQMNDDDSRQMANMLQQLGYREASSESEADIILLNTCSVREKPEQKVRSKIGEYRALKEINPHLIVGVCGCMAQREGKELLKYGSPIDMVIGTASIYELPMLIEKAKAGKRRIVSDKLPERGKANGSGSVTRTVANVGLKAFVPVMFGCNNFCTYCVVPSARGPERSRPAAEIVEEITALVSQGCREVTLVGQNVNSYKGAVEGGTADFADLLAMVNDIKGLLRIRFTTSHPKDLSDKLITAMVELPKVCEHLHLPIQSGDDEILGLMGRKYTAKDYLALVDKLRAAIPSMAITTDIMVGFPGESNDHFRNTMDIVNEVRYDAAFMFAFNPRPGTPAAKMEGQIESSAKTRRLIELIAVQNEITLEKNQEQAGEIFDVLVEGPSEKDPEKLTGYTRTNRTVNFRGAPTMVGRIVKIRAVTAHPWGFGGELIRGK